jgi:hypothetical protein
VGHESSHFQKIRFADLFRDAIFKRFNESNESNESSRILSTIDLRIRNFWIREYLRCSKDSFRGFVSYYGVQKIRFVDSFCKKKKVKKVRFVSIWKDSCTNPASFYLILSPFRDFCQKFELPPLCFQPCASMNKTDHQSHFNRTTKPIASFITINITNVLITNHFGFVSPYKQALSANGMLKL